MKNPYPDHLWYGTLLELFAAKASFKCPILAGIAAMLMVHSVNAASSTWSGSSTSDGNWNTSAN